VEHWIARITEHGYVLLFLVAFLETFGLPIPASLAILVAGAASARGMLNPWWVAGGTFLCIATGDSLMFWMGRRTGWWLLSLLCRLSLNPESCILRSADAFYRRGRALLLFAKFVPGINTMAPPLAGSMNMRFGHFTVGLLFSDALEKITRGYETFGHIAAWILAAGLAIFIGTRIWAWRKTTKLLQAPYVEPVEASRELLAGTAVVFDVRSHGYYLPKALRVEGARRLDPNSLNQVELDFPVDKEVYVYCTCHRDATSAQVARTLRGRGVLCSVIRGGLRAWTKAGLPVEVVPAEEMLELPVFET
jgi:membrane protein DedA with SNARE-associated domain/rhodanese-related sulfurtransferase